MPFLNARLKMLYLFICLFFVFLMKSSAMWTEIAKLVRRREKKQGTAAAAKER